MKILYVDDEQSTLNAFAQNHARDRVFVETRQDSSDVVERLTECASADLPNLIVLDLYATKDVLNSAEAAQVNQQVDDLVRQISDKRKELATVVHHSKTPTGLETLKRLKATPSLRDIPVVLTTREGLSLIGDEQYSESVQLGANWIMKGRKAQTERTFFFKVVNDARHAGPRIKRDVSLMIVGTLLGTALSLGIPYLVSQI
ncbi:MAG: hypothetical protein ABF285_08500 [Pacificibacter sp.]|uniref:hypothetical protein n=1 Tax=Pacificibacter sp. TaxID=1917866 RepID=UPI00321AF70D